MGGQKSTRLTTSQGEEEDRNGIEGKDGRAGRGLGKLLETRGVRQKKKDATCGTGSNVGKRGGPEEFPEKKSGGGVGCEM